MSSMASNYDMSRLFLGQSIAGAACVAAVSVAAAASGQPSLLSPPMALTLAYGIMMFASSYVEEEHHFWYWTTSAWLAFLTMKQLRR